MCEQVTIGRNAPKLMIEFDEFLTATIEKVEAVGEPVSGGRATGRLVPQWQAGHGWDQRDGAVVLQRKIGWELEGRSQSHAQMTGRMLGRPFPKQKLFVNS
jgi:hypothetical protein